MIVSQNVYKFSWEGVRFSKVFDSLTWSDVTTSNFNTWKSYDLIYPRWSTWLFFMENKNC